MDFFQDSQIGEDKKRYKLQGGCTVLVSLFILGKLYVANAGDSRGVLCRRGAAYPMSHDFTPVSERQRLQQVNFKLKSKASLFALLYLVSNKL